MSARVLVVDDILPNVKLLEAKLSSEYYDVLTATSGEEALKLADSDRPDLILLDVMMPGMDGFEVCRRIKGNPELAHIPVVMVTALTDSVDKVRGLEAGADDFLSKPVNDTALMARVSSLVRLKMTVDEWRARESTATQLGVVDDNANVMNEPTENARVLVVEDLNFEADKIAETLHQDNDNVIPVDSGMNAMEYVSQHDFDLLIISLNLKNEDGLRLCSHLRSNERTRAIPILMVASEEDMDRIARGLEIGAHDYILRPVDRNELLARARTQIRRKRFQERLRTSYEYSLSMALTDSLTGLYNRRYFDVHLQKMLKTHKDSAKNLSVMILDIDHFKEVNDKHGHVAGDEVLKVFAHRLQDNLRSFDMVARLGGEEFVVVLPDTTPHMTYFIAERLRRAVADKPVKCSVPEGEISISTSIGGAVIEPGDYEVQEILDRVDKFLYEAKNGGRNCCIFESVGRLNPEEYMQSPREVGK
ncbi:MAG TPA: PleD family two-component system response regulator [Micavibrio sp.]|nr:PleD family two-component system response regulator [Pseudomonadota bacterium]MEC8665697.1 PleD family two-component system response regulator [Pseudomonadota bacterium]HIF24773.1 PleD family two-component system response regulator [Micavibrio sp.]HIL29701.1 PleD family two-component system response regulator [Micavibrio sp.]